MEARPKIEHAGIELVPASLFEPLSFAEVFARNGPVEIDVGCGEGTFVIALAAQNPHRNYLAIERLLGRVRSVCHKAGARGLTNLRVLRMDATYALAHLIPPGSVSAVHLLFPDPWPKRRHHRRRTVTGEFLGTLHRILVPGGLLHIATDHADYFVQIKQLVTESGSFATANDPPSFPPSRFEEKFTRERLEIHRLLLRKISPVR